MFVERQMIKSKSGCYRELQELLERWSEEFPFPRAVEVRRYYTYAGQDYHEISQEWEFESLDDLQKGWEAWEAMSSEMAPYLEKFQELVEHQSGPELWRVSHSH